MRKAPYAITSAHINETASGVLDLYNKVIAGEIQGITFGAITKNREVRPGCYGLARTNIVLGSAAANLVADIMKDLLAEALLKKKK